MHAGRDDRPHVEARHVLGHMLRDPVLLRQRHVEERLGGVRLERPRRVHRRKGRRALKRRGLLQRRLHIAGNGNDVVRANKRDQRIECPMKRIQQIARRGMDHRQLGKNLLRRLGGINQLRHAGKLRLVPVQIVEGNRQQTVQRNVDHLVVGQLLLECLGAQAEVAVGAWQQVRLHPRAIALQRRNHRSIRFGKLRLGRRIGCDLRPIRPAEECAGHVVLEEADVAVDLLQRNFGKDTRRVLQVLARLQQRLRHLLLALHQSAQPRVRWRVGPLHNHEGRAGDPRRVAVGVLLPPANHLQRQQLRADIVQ